MSHNIPNSIKIKLKSIITSKDRSSEEVEYLKYFGWDLVASHEVGPEEGQLPNSVRLIFTPNQEMFKEFMTATKQY